MSRLRALRCGLGLATVFVVGLSLQAADPARVLFVTQSKGFRHGSVNRRANKLAPAEIAMTQLGQQTRLFTVDCTQDCQADFTAANLKKYQVVMLSLIHI